MKYLVCLYLINVITTAQLESQRELFHIAAQAVVLTLSSINALILMLEFL